MVEQLPCHTYTLNVGTIYHVQRHHWPAARIMPLPPRVPYRAQRSLQPHLRPSRWPRRRRRRQRRTPQDASGQVATGAARAQSLGRTRSWVRVRGASRLAEGPVESGKGMQMKAAWSLHAPNTRQRIDSMSAPGAAARRTKSSCGRCPGRVHGRRTRGSRQSQGTCGRPRCAGRGSQIKRTARTARRP